jgi:opacity protein-like surface antigen
LNTRERLSFEIDARARHVERRGTAGVSFALTPKISADAQAEYWQMAFDGDEVFDDFGLAAQLNRESLTASGGVSYRATPLTTVRVLGDVSRIRFDEASFRDTDTRQMLFGVELNPRALISGSARVGYQRFRPLNSAVPEFNGVVGAASVSYRLRPSTSVGFNFDRRTDFSYIIVEPYYVREGYGVSIRRRLPAQWDVALNAARTSHRYLRLLRPEEDTLEGHREKFFDAGVTLGYDVGPRTRMTIDLTYQNRNSDFDERGYDGVHFGVSVIYGF